MMIDVGYRAPFETKPMVIQLPLPHVDTPLGIHLLYYETNHLTYANHVDQDTAFGRAFPLHFRRNIYVLAIEAFYPVMVDHVITAFNSCQSANAIVSIQVWIVNHNSASRTDIEEQRIILDQVCFVPVPVLLEAVVCCAVTMKSPFKTAFKGAHFENYDNMYINGTWSFTVLRSLVPDGAVILPIRPAYAVKSTSA
jgi:hypothetical protein